MGFLHSELLCEGIKFRSEAARIDKLFTVFSKETLLGVKQPRVLIEILEAEAMAVKDGMRNKRAEVFQFLWSVL